MAEFLNREKSIAELIEIGSYGNNSDDEIPPYSDQEAIILAHKLINYETFMEARRVLIAWYQNGECNANNYGKIFFLTQICFDYQRIFESTQKEALKEIEAMKEMLALQNFDSHCNLYRIEKTIKMMETPEIYDGFSPDQKERIKAVKREVSQLWEKFFRERICNTSVENGSGKVRIACNERNMLIFKQLSDSLRLEELERRAERKEFEQLLMLKAKLDAENPIIKKGADYKSDLLRTIEKPLRSLAAMFLYRHTTGVNIDEIHSYINAFIPIIIDAEDVEIFLRRFPEDFGEVEKKWFYIGSFIESPNMI